MASLIKKSRRGLLHRKLGVPQDETIPPSKLAAAKHAKSPALRREANFAINFNKPGRAAYNDAKKHFGDNEIARAIGRHAHEQAGGN